MSMMDPDDLDSNVVGIAAFLYILADLNQTVRDVTTPNYHNLRMIELNDRNMWDKIYTEIDYYYEYLRYLINIGMFWIWIEWIWKYRISLMLKIDYIDEF